MSAGGNLLKYADEIFRGAAKEGGLLYRFERQPWRLFDKGIAKDYRNLPRYTNIEPRGIYFANNIKNIPDLLDPGVGNTSDTMTYLRGAGRDFYKQLEMFPETLSGKRREIYDAMKRSLAEGKNYSPYGMIKAAVNPDDIKDLGNPDEWADYLLQLASESGRDMKVVRNAVFDTGHTHTNGLELFQNDITKDLLDKGYAGVKFPDTVAGQPHINQVAMFKPGHTLIKSGKEVALISGAATAIGLPLSQRLGLKDPSKIDVSGE